MAWSIEFERSAKRDLAKLDHATSKRILAFLRDRIAPLDDPRTVGGPLKGEAFGDYWRYRVGDYRVIALIEDKTIRILIVRIGNCRDVYRSRS